MADEKRSAKGYTTLTTGLVFPVLTPSLSVSGYDDANITYNSLFYGINLTVSENAADIAVLESETALLNEITTKRLIQSTNIPVPITQDKDEHFYKVIFRQVSGTSNVGIGTADDDGDIATIRVIDDTGFKTITTSIAPSVADRTIYFIVQGGVVDIAIYSSTNVFEL